MPFPLTLTLRPIGTRSMRLTHITCLAHSIAAKHSDYVHTLIKHVMGVASAEFGY